MQETNFDFPVSLKSVFTPEQKEVPRVKAVVREDTEEPIATVSDRYHLITHKEVMDEAQNFIKEFGQPQAKFYLGHNGATLVGEYTYRENCREVNVGDTVGLRVYIENSYNATKSLRFRIGALRLKCLNGMVGAKDLFDLRFRHTRGREIHFPDPEAVVASFGVATDKWRELTKAELTTRDYEHYGNQLVEQGLLPSKFVDKNHLFSEADPQTGINAWALYNDATRFITHEARGGQIGKVNRLGRIDSWFSSVFLNQNNAEVEENANTWSQ